MEYRDNDKFKTIAVYFDGTFIDDRMSDKFKLPFIARHSHYGKMGKVDDKVERILEEIERFDD